MNLVIELNFQKVNIFFVLVFENITDRISFCHVKRRQNNDKNQKFMIFEVCFFNQSV